MSGIRRYLEVSGSAADVTEVQFQEYVKRVFRVRVESDRYRVEVGEFVQVCFDGYERAGRRIAASRGKGLYRVLKICPAGPILVQFTGETRGFEQDPSTAWWCKSWIRA